MSSWRIILSWEDPPDYTDEELEYLQGFFTEKKDEDGSTYRYNKKGQFHNTRGPAYIDVDGTVEYWVRGKCHRTDGPAIIYPDGTVEYWVNDEPLSEEEFNQKYGRNRRGSLQIEAEEVPEGGEWMWIGFEEAKREYGSVYSEDGTEIAIIEQAFIVYNYMYAAHGRDRDGNDYLIKWGTIDGWEEALEGLQDLEALENSDNPLTEEDTIRFIELQGLRDEYLSFISDETRACDWANPIDIRRS